MLRSNEASYTTRIFIHVISFITSFVLYSWGQGRLPLLRSKTRLAKSLERDHIHCIIVDVLIKVGMILRMQIYLRFIFN